MKQMIDELKSIPGVVGACVYSTRAGLKFSNLPGIFKPERLTAVGKHLAKLYSAGRMSFDDLTDVSLYYEESVVVARELQKNLLVFVVCDPSFNHNLLAMSFNLLQEELQDAGFEATEAEMPASHQSAGGRVVSRAEADGQLLGLCNELKDLLGKVLGPMAGYIFDETAETWEQKGSVDFDRIEELIEMLNQEISDPDKIKHYRKLITPELNSYRKG
jgi:predicted regulator of Ras-like GTPase activity (Roadblock/LC7/MglB family)